MKFVCSQYILFIFYDEVLEYAEAVICKTKIEHIFVLLELIKNLEGLP